MTRMESNSLTSMMTNSHFSIDESVEEEARDEQSQGIKTNKILGYKANSMQDDNEQIPDEMIL